MSFNIAIDGPAGAGKSTIAKMIAEKLKFIYVDTGAMYRAMALYMIRENISGDEAEKIEAACERVDVTIQYIDGVQQVILNGENVNGFIRTEEVGKMASAVGLYKKVRLKLVELQRKLAKEANVIMDGREIGTFVLPDAQIKVYLTASAHCRAKRRFLELEAKGIDCKMEEIEADIVARDKQDMEREFAPLKQADDAILLDSSNLTIDEVVDQIVGLYEKAVR